MTLPNRMKFGMFLGPFHELGENPTLGLERDLELIQWIDQLGFDEAWIGEHHSAGWETISSPELFMATAAERTRHIKLGTGVMSLPFHHPLMAANRMVLLDHLTRGRIMMGTGPNVLLTDAYMLGVDPRDSRRRWDESLGIIMRLLNEPDPITYQSDWFTLREALLHLRPYTQPHFPIAVASSASATGPTLAGKYGIWLLSNVALGSMKPDLPKLWEYTEQSAAEHGNLVDRHEWRLNMIVHLAETRKEAVEQARMGAARYQRVYTEDTAGGDTAFDGPADKIIDHMIGIGAWCIGTPDDLIDTINRLDEESGGFGGFLIHSTEFGTREEVLRSFELIARYVMPRFQGSLVNLTTSQQWAAEKRQDLMALRKQSIQRATETFREKGS